MENAKYLSETIISDDVHLSRRTPVKGPVMSYFCNQRRGMIRFHMLASVLISVKERARIN